MNFSTTQIKSALGKTQIKSVLGCNPGQSALFVTQHDTSGHEQSTSEVDVIWLGVEKTHEVMKLSRGV